MLTVYCTYVALCLSQLSHSTEETGTQTSSREAYCKTIPVMRIHQTGGIDLFVKSFERSVSLELNNRTEKISLITYSVCV